MVKMVAEIVSVGTEHLLGQIVDSHAVSMARILADLGVDHLQRQTVGDHLGRLTQAIHDASKRAQIVILIGGLGPTEDDLTREALANATGKPLQVQGDEREKLIRWFAGRGIPWVASQERQSYLPEGAEFVENPYGTASGICLKTESHLYLALPGPRGEFQPMADGPVRREIAAFAGSGAILSRMLRVAGLGESVVEDRIRPLLSSNNPTVAPYAHPGEVHLRVAAQANTAEEAMLLLEPMEAQIRELLGSAIYGIDSVTLEETIIRDLESGSKTVGCAESCTGGLLSARLTAVSGASNVFPGGIVSYANAVKEKFLGVSKETLREYGAVSEQCCLEMAKGIRDVMDVTYGLSITGIAGPEGGSEDKPVGLVFVGIAGPYGQEVRRLQLHGLREDIRQRASQAALLLLRESLLRER